MVSATHNRDWVIRFAAKLVRRIEQAGFLRQTEYPSATSPSMTIVKDKVYIKPF